MPLLRINASDEGIVLHNTPQPASKRLCALAARPGPAIIMVHGYKYAPGTTNHCPHRKIFGKTQHSWPEQLGFDANRAGSGLGIALGWDARGSLRAMHERAANLGETIAVIVAMLRAHTPERPVHIIAHSLGVEAALSALQHLPGGSVDRMILLTGASFAGRATQMLETPAGRSAEVLNVTSRENDFFDAAFETLIRPPAPNDPAIGKGIKAPNVVNLQLDCATSIRAVEKRGFVIGAANKRICHWSAYKRPGMMDFYKCFLRTPDKLPLALLRQELPQQAAPRWSRLFARHPKAVRTPPTALPLASRSVGSV